MIDVNETWCWVNVTETPSKNSDTKNLRYYLCGPFLAVTIIVGLVGNALSLIVFCRGKNRPRIYYYLIVLAAWDIGLLLCSFILYSTPVLLYGRFYNYGTYVLIFPTFYMFSNMAHSGSIWIVVVLAVERYFALCQPMKYLTWDTAGRAKILLGTVSALAVFYHIPRFFEVRMRYCENLAASSWHRVEFVPLVLPSDLRSNEAYKILKIAGGLMFFSFGPLITLSLLTARVTLEVRKNMVLQRSLTGSDRRRKFSSSNRQNKPPSSASIKSTKGEPRQSKEEKQALDLMLVAVMVKFCVCHTLPTVLDVCETIMGDDWDVGRFRWLDTVIDVSNVLVVVNSSCNFIIYYASSCKFRSGLRAVGRRSSDYALLKLRSISEGYGVTTATTISDHTTATVKITSDQITMV